MGRNDKDAHEKAKPSLHLVRPIEQSPEGLRLAAHELFRSLKGQMTNLFKITPRKENEVWLFDDPSVGLQGEPFVSGADDIIEAMADAAGATERQKTVGIGVYFSDSPFSINGKLATLLVREGFESLPEAVVAGACGEQGAWYQGEVNGMQMRGWLCPATLKYFPVHPPMLYALMDTPVG